MKAQPITKKYNFVFLFDCKMGNPNGDPDADNMPRMDMATEQGLVSDACLKRKVRNFVELRKSTEPGFKLYIKGDSTLNAKDDEAFTAVDGGKKEKSQKNPDTATKLRGFMCDNYWDIRAFGGVMTSFSKVGVSGGIRGPVQFSMAVSESPIEPMNISISRTAVATEAEAKKSNTTFGNKFIIPYGLYRMEGTVSPTRAQETGFSESDLSLLWESIINMFEDDQAAARGTMCARELVVFEHESMYGNAPAYKLAERVSVVPKHPDAPIRAYSDYTVEVDTAHMPASVSCMRMI